MSFQLSLFSASLFTFPHLSIPVQSHTSFIHVLLGAPTFLFPSILPSKICKCVTPLEPLNTCPAYFSFLSLCLSIYIYIFIYIYAYFYVILCSIIHVCLFV